MKINGVKSTGLLVLVVGTLVCLFVRPSLAADQMRKDRPHIVNIVNFIRQLEPRYPKVTQDVLYQTVVSQIELMNKYKLGGTFLLQYDALMDSRYQELLKKLPSSTFEVGGWWEIPQPLAEKAGLKWRGRYPWDWHANVGFSVGYTPEEREKLVDAYMNDFKQIYGYFPKSVGSWYIDEHTLNYMYQKYGIVASCNCRDQIGTDGYTLWGGYWNQAYYPSKQNAYMPAQTEANQIPVPIFRMLGSDHVPQYDAKLKMKRQGNVTIEPVYKYSGGDSIWVNWYLKEFADNKCMDFNYVQIGQENSFTWEKMEEGLKYQFPLIAQLRDQKKVKVETLAQSGKWFRSHYKTTPATAVCVKKDLPGSDCKTVWFDSRFYRANLLWEHNAFRITDIHLFDENLASDYLTKPEPTDKFHLYTLPFIDGYTPTADKIEGLRLKAVVDGKTIDLEGSDPIIDDEEPGILTVSWSLKAIRGKFIVLLNEQKMKFVLESKANVFWFLELGQANNASEHLKTISAKKVDCQFKQSNYTVTALAGSFSQTSYQTLFRIIPEDNQITLNLSRSK